MLEVKVITVKPDVESQDWCDLFLKARRWNVIGVIVSHSNSHGLIYQVRHLDDSTIAWYEARELQLVD